MISKEYAAGFFDGEGSVIMQKNYQVFVVLTQGDLDILKEFQRIWGGYVVTHKSELSARPCYQWRLSKKSLTVKFLTDIKDHLILKKTKVLLALEMLDLLRGNDERDHLVNGKYAKTDTVPKQRILDQFKSLKLGYKPGRVIA